MTLGCQHYVGKCNVIQESESNLLYVILRLKVFYNVFEKLLI